MILPKEQTSLSFNHISHGVDKTLDYINDLRTGKIKSLKTSKEKLNKTILNGIDWNRILTIAGLSGSGKSTILEELKRDFIELNDCNSFEILSFEFEMLIEDQLVRHLSSKLNKPTKKIYSAEESLTNEEFEKAKQILQEHKKSPIFYVDNAGTVDQIVNTILTFVEERNLIQHDKGIVITIDHVLLTKGKQSDAEKAIVDDLMRAFISLKKYFSSIGLRCIFIVLSQLNRDIESPERITNSMLHYPTKNDIFAASSVYYCSDYVIITHKPSQITGIGEFYGPPMPKKGFPKGLPTRCPTNSEQSMIYWHVIKERFGVSKIIPVLEDFKNARTIEYNL
jgi:replicative DNA helicase